MPQLRAAWSVDCGSMYTLKPLYFTAFKFTRNSTKYYLTFDQMQYEKYQISLIFLPLCTCKLYCLGLKYVNILLLFGCLHGVCMLQHKADIPSGLNAHIRKAILPV